MTDLPDEYLLALGTIAVHSARLESELTHVLMRALSTRNAGVWSMLAAESFNVKIEKLKLLASREVEVNGERSRGPLNDIVSDEFAAMLDGLARRLDRARVVRNRMMHSTWHTEPDGVVIRTQVRLRGMSRTDQVPTSVDELRESARVLADGVEAIMNASYDQLSGKVHNDWGMLPGSDG